MRPFNDQLLCNQPEKLNLLALIFAGFLRCQIHNSLARYELQPSPHSIPSAQAHVCNQPESLPSSYKRIDLSINLHARFWPRMHIVPGPVSRSVLTRRQGKTINSGLTRHKNLPLPCGDSTNLFPTLRVSPANTSV